MNLYKVTTIGLITGLVIACGAAGSDPTSVARADDAGAGSAGDCVCTGQPGLQGEPGAQGPAGPAGKDAVCAAGMGQCPPGVAGPAGPDGAKGTDGSSCSATGGGDTVQVACTNGTMATLTALPGPKGDKGPQGDKGDSGSQGIQGVPGDKGAPGAEGFAITKSSLYTRSSALSAGTAIAYCDDANDIALNGYCVGQATFWAGIGAYQPTGEDTKSGWECKSGNVGGNPVGAAVVCLGVP